DQLIDRRNNEDIVWKRVKENGDCACRNTRKEPRREPRLLFVVRKPCRTAASRRIVERLEAGDLSLRSGFGRDRSGLASRRLLIRRSREPIEFLLRGRKRDLRLAARAG